MRTLDLSELTKIHGGYDEAGCNAAQALGQKLAQDKNATDKQWDQFEEMFEKYC